MFVFVSTVGVAQNRVLNLGTNGTVVVPVSVLNGLEEVTIEGWVRRTGDPSEIDLFGYRAHFRRLLADDVIPRITLTAGPQAIVPGLIPKVGWSHLAAAIGKEGTVLYFNGTAFATNQAVSSALLSPSIPNSDRTILTIGTAAERLLILGEGQPEGGAIDEIRIWKGIRNEPQIRETMERSLIGPEKDLVALWNFEDGTVRDATERGYDGTISGDAFIETAAIPHTESLPAPFIIDGAVKDSGGAFASGIVFLETPVDGLVGVRFVSANGGRFRLAGYGEAEVIALTVVSGNELIRRTEKGLKPGELRSMDFEFLGGPVDPLGVEDLLMKTLGAGQISARREAGEELDWRTANQLIRQREKLFRALLVASEDSDTTVRETAFRCLKQLGLPSPLDHFLETKQSAQIKWMSASLIPFALIYLFLFFNAPRVRVNLYFALTAIAGIGVGFAITHGKGAFLTALVSMLFSLFSFLGVPEISQELREQLPFLGIAAFVLAGSAHLARQFAGTNRALTQRTDELALSKQLLQQERRSADKASSAKNLFLANLNQEIRAPINAILGYARILRREANLSEKHRCAVETLEKSGNCLLVMVNDMLDLAKIEAGRIEPRNRDFDLGALIESLIVMFRVRCEEKNLSFKVEWDSPATAETGRRFGEIENEAATHAGDSRSRSPAIPLYGDERKLRQVLVSLLANAVKFTDHGLVKLRISFFSSTEFSKREIGGPANPSIPKHGLLSVTDGTDAAPTDPRVAQEKFAGTEDNPGDPNRRDSAAAAHSGSASIYRFEVIDTGPGISHGAQLRLFEPFQQEAEGLKRGGAGLGLALARRQVEIMGGNLRVHSELGKGARFYLDVPLAQAISNIGTTNVVKASEISRLAPGHSVKALVVDDVRENREVLIQLLSGIGCSVRDAENGNQALALLREELPQIVFMDIRMPGMWGDEALKRIAAEFGEKKPRVVAISASALALERESYMKAGFDEFLSKPVRFHLLCDTLWRLLNVEFQYAETNTKDFGAFPVPDPDHVRIPGYLRELLRQAAGSSNAAKLEKTLQELEKTGENEREIAGYLRHLARQGDLGEVTKFLSKVKAR